ncbi:MAG: methylmalonyl-CoA mutase [bacterium]|nr:methylmalonyl-CoA mutase [bacterium]
MPVQEPAAPPPFPSPSLEQWRALVDRDLAGAPFAKKLVTRTLEGIEIAPLYTRADQPPAVAGEGWPGQAPYTRGALGCEAAPGWDIRQEVTHPDPAVAGQQVRQELARGAASVQLCLDPAGAAGVAVRGADDLDLALAGVDFATTRVALKSGARFVPAAQQLREVWERRGLAAADAKADLLADPIGAWVVRGGAPGGLEALLTAMASLAAAAAKETPQVRAVKMAGCPFHDAGADDAQELAAILSGGLAYLKAMDAAGLDLASAARQIHVCVAVDGQFFGDIAKLRALRTVWSRLVEASGGAPQARRAHLHARTSWRMMTARDPWVNLLRTTTAAFAAGVGGAEVVTVLPFDAAVNEPDDFSRRLARNVQIVLQQEASLGRVLDPAGGCWHLEARTAALAERAWILFQELEGRGGLVASLRDGWFQEKIAATRQARARDVATRRLPLTGVSEFPQLDERPVARPRPAPPPGAPPTPAPLQDAIAPLAAVRLSAPFEALRDAADRHLATTGARPRAFLANLGRLAQFSARAGFARNLLAAGGIAAEGEQGYDDAAALAAALRASGCRLAVICSTDELYAERLPAAAAALKGAGAATVVVAGRMGEHEAAWRAAGVDRAIYLGCDVLETLGALLDGLEVQR